MWNEDDRVESPDGRYPVYWYNMRKFSENPDVQDQIESFYDNVLQPEHKDHIRHKKLAGLNNVLTNLVVGHGRELPVACHRNYTRYYKIPARYGMPHMTYDIIIKAIVNNLIHLDLVDYKEGNYQPWFEPTIVSTISAKDELWEHFEVDGSDGWGAYNEFYSDPVILKDRKTVKKYKRFVDYDDNQDTRSWRQSLASYNQLMEDTSIQESAQAGPPGTPAAPPSSISTKNGFLEQAAFPNILDGRAYRIWSNGKFELGGRFYGPDYQSLNSERRANLLINGNPVIELDFSGFHLRLLYHQLGHDYQEDPYTAVASDEASRNLLKHLCIISLNAKSEYSTFESILNNPEFQGDLRKSPYDLDDLIRRFKHVHSRLSDYFYSGHGLTLQNNDSNIAADVLSYFTAKKIPCLSVHDSFIVEEQHEDELRQVMTDVYKEHVNGFEPVIK